MNIRKTLTEAILDTIETYEIKQPSKMRELALKSRKPAGCTDDYLRKVLGMIKNAAEKGFTTVTILPEKHEPDLIAATAQSLFEMGYEVDDHGGRCLEIRW